MSLFKLCPNLKPATTEQLKQLGRQGFYNHRFAREHNLPRDLVALRAGFYFLPEGEGYGDDAFDAWVEYTDALNVDFDTFEAIDMALSFA